MQQIIGIRKMAVMIAGILAIIAICYIAKIDSTAEKKLTLYYTSIISIVALVGGHSTIQGLIDKKNGNKTKT